MGQSEALVLRERSMVNGIFGQGEEEGVLKQAGSAGGREPRVRDATTQADGRCSGLSATAAAVRLSMTLPTPFTFLPPSAGVDDERCLLLLLLLLFFFPPSKGYFLAIAGIKVDYIIGRKRMFRSDRPPDHVSPAKPFASAAAKKGSRSQLAWQAKDRPPKTWRPKNRQKGE